MSELDYGKIRKAYNTDTLKCCIYSHTYIANTSPINDTLNSNPILCPLQWIGNTRKSRTHAYRDFRHLESMKVVWYDLQEERQAPPADVHCNMCVLAVNAMLAHFAVASSNRSVRDDIASD